MNKEETEERLEEAVELMITHLGGSDYQTWEIKDKIYANQENRLILTFEVEYEDDEEDD